MLVFLMDVNGLSKLLRVLHLEVLHADPPISIITVSLATPTRFSQLESPVYVKSFTAQFEIKDAQYSDVIPDIRHILSIFLFLGSLPKWVVNKSSQFLAPKVSKVHTSSLLLLFVSHQHILKRVSNEPSHVCICLSGDEAYQ